MGPAEARSRGGAAALHGDVPGAGPADECDTKVSWTLARQPLQEMLTRVVTRGFPESIARQSPHRATGPGSLRPAAGRKTDVGRSRRDRAAGGSARTCRVVRSGQSRVGSVLRECGRRQAEHQQGARAWKGATWTMRRRSRWPSQVIGRDRERSSRVWPGLPGRYVRSIHVSADASGPVLIEHR